MAYCPPDRSPRASASGSRKGARKKRSPSDQRRAEARAAAQQQAVTERIDTTARKRHRAWVAREVNAAATCTTDLVELYEEHRGEQAGTLTDPYRGRTTNPDQWVAPCQ
jgi:hypothetical protein